MPLLLQNAYGESWGSGGRRVTGSFLGSAVPEVSEPVQQQQVAAETRVDHPLHMPVVREEMGYRTKRGGDYVINLSIRIDQQDAHLLCLFLGVFILSVLFTKNKKLSPTSLL